jgi:hypothetical protein
MIFLISAEDTLCSKADRKVAIFFACGLPLPKVLPLVNFPVPLRPLVDGELLPAIDAPLIDFCAALPLIFSK